MAVTADKVVTILEARTAQHDRNIRQSEALFTRSMNSISKSAGLARAAVGGIFAGIVAGGGLQAARQLIDSSTKIQNSLKSTGLRGEELTKVYDKLFASAQKNSVPLEALSTLYGRLALNQRELGVTTEQLTSLTDTVGASLRAGGADANQAAGALLQLGQALGGGKVQAEEYNSLIDGMPVLLQAAAAGIQETGGSVAKLTQLVKSGQVSSKAFFDAIQAGAPLIEQRLSGAEQTISGSFVRLQNVLVDAAGKFNESTEAAKLMAEGVDSAAAFINNIDFDGIIKELQRVTAQINDTINSWQNYAAEAGRALGMDRVAEGLVRGIQLGTGGVGPTAGGIQSQRIIENRIADAFSDTVETAGAVTEKAIQDAARRNGVVVTGQGKTSRLPPAPAKIKPISLSDYEVPASSSGGKAAAKKIATEAQKAADKLSDSIARQASVAVDAASQYIGQHEKKNAGSINSFLRAGGVDLNAATTAWCAAFVNSALSQVGIKGSGSNVATDFMNWGVKVDKNQIQRGDVVVDPNGRSAGQTGGHVGFATGQVRATAEGIQQIEILSGNASNKVQTDWVNASDVVARRAAEGFEIATDSLSNLTDQTEAAKVASDRLAESQAAWGNIARTAIQGLASALQDGKLEAEELLQILFQVVEQMLAMPSIGGAGGGGFGGLFSLLGGLFMAKGGPVKKGQPYIVGEKRPELFVPNQSGRIVPRVPNIGMPSRERAQTIIQMPVAIDATGADAAGLARVDRALLELKRSIPTQIDGRTSVRSTRGSRPSTS